MKPEKSEFDHFAAKYDELLRDPIRERFTGGDSQFFHVRKHELILNYYRRRGIDTRELSVLDLGCGMGNLLKLLRPDFRKLSGCDVSAEMLEWGKLAEHQIDSRLQTSATSIPFDAAEFDFVTAVCVYHHIPPELRGALTAEVRRVLKPGGVFAIIEHNPYNPATRIIVSRTPVDADAILLPAGETRRMLRTAGFRPLEQEYFLYFPERLYLKLGVLERLLRRLPLGGQYAAFATNTGV